MPAGLHKFVCEQGATFSRTVTVSLSGVALNLTGYTARMKVRPSVGSASTLLSLTSGAELTLGGVAGTITILVSATATAALSPVFGVYDLEIVDSGGFVRRILEGKFLVVAEVTV